MANIVKKYFCQLNFFKKNICIYGENLKKNLSVKFLEKKNKKTGKQICPKRWAYCSSKCAGLK